MHAIASFEILIIKIFITQIRKSMQILEANQLRKKKSKNMLAI